MKATNGDGTITAHEAQLSYQPISTIQERTHDYTKIGMESFWWLGNNFDRAYLRKLEAVNIKCGRVEISEDYTVTFSFSPNGIVLPTRHGGKARIIAYNSDRDIYQTASQVWWNIKNGVLVEAPIIQ